MDIVGYDVVCAELRHATRFHDDEVLRIELDRLASATKIRLYVLAMGIQPSQAHIVVILFEEIDNLNISGFNHQNVIQEIEADTFEHGFRVQIFSNFGAEASFTCRRASMDVGKVLGR